MNTRVRVAVAARTPTAVVGTEQARAGWVTPHVLGKPETPRSSIPALGCPILVGRTLGSLWDVVQVGEGDYMGKRGVAWGV